MKFNKIYNNLLENNKVEEKLDWKSLLAAGLIAAPGAAKDMPAQPQRPAIQRAVTSELDFKDVVGVLKRFENSKNYPKGNFNKKTQKWHIYDDVGKQAIAYGHNLSQQEIANKTFVNGITDEQATDLLQKDIARKRQEVTSFIPKFNQYPQEVQNAIIVATFRGDLKKEHKTTALINKGDFLGAAEEFLNHKDYRNAPPTSDLRKRLEGISNEFRKYGETLQKPVAKDQKSR